MSICRIGHSYTYEKIKMNRMNLNKRIEAFVKLGAELIKYADDFINVNSNSWFTPENVKYALSELSKSLNQKNIQKWLSAYHELKKNNSSKRVGVVTAGNIPLVGFHDFISVLISGNIFVGKLSSKDDKLFLKLINILINIEPRFEKYIDIKKDKLSDFEAVIATGSNNSARYFEYYFGKYPNIIRKNRNSVAVITGNETDEELELLIDDIFMYFGLGCRNVSKLFLPDDYNLDKIFRAAEKYKSVINNTKYYNNYGYNRSIYLMNKTVFWDNNFMLLKEDIGMASPVSVVYFENYSNIETVKKRLELEKENIQCIVSSDKIIEDSICFGETQKPNLWDYADNVDTLKFLIEN